MQVSKICYYVLPSQSAEWDVDTVGQGLQDIALCVLSKTPDM